MSGHTPGEWEANRYDEIWSVEVLDGGAANIKTFVASVHDVEDVERSKANARLIAAAPDLLKAARAMVGYHTGDGLKRRTGTSLRGCSNCGGLPHSATCHILAFEAAIAKAEGR